MFLDPRPAPRLEDLPILPDENFGHYYQLIIAAMHMPYYNHHSSPTTLFSQKIARQPIRVVHICMPSIRIMC